MTNVLLNFVLEEWVLLSLLTALFALYFHYTSTFSFFREKGIEYMNPTILVGNVASRLLLKTSFHQFQKDIYDNFAGLPYGGLRFALVSSKLAMATLLKEFKFSTSEKTVHPVVFQKKGFLLKSANGLWVHVSPIN